MRHPALLDPERSVLVLIDLQEGYRTVLHAWSAWWWRAASWSRAWRSSAYPSVTEQYPRGLGHTAPEVAGRFPAGLQVVEKMA